MCRPLHITSAYISLYVSDVGLALMIWVISAAKFVPVAKSGYAAHMRGYQLASIREICTIYIS